MRSFLLIIVALAALCAPCAAQDEVFNYFANPVCTNWNALDNLAGSEDQQAVVSLLKISYINGVMDTAMVFCYGMTPEGENTDHCTFPLSFDEYIDRINKECKNPEKAEILVSVVMIGMNIELHKE